MGLPITFEFMTAADFEAVSCPTWKNEIKKIKLHTYTSPAAGINFLLAVVGPFTLTSFVVVSFIPR